MAQQRIFSGIQPTGRKHLGNYIGAIRQYVEGQDRGEAIYCIVDLHAITVPQDPAELRERLYDTTAILIAAGLDPSAASSSASPTSSSTPSSAGCSATVTAWGDLNRMHQFKEKAEQQRELVSAGLFFYPGAPGGRRPRLSRHRGPGGRRPAPAHRADARHRRALQRALRRRSWSSRRAATRRSGPGS